MTREALAKDTVQLNWWYNYNGRKYFSGGEDGSGRDVGMTENVDMWDKRYSGNGKTGRQRRRTVLPAAWP